MPGFRFNNGELTISTRERAMVIRAWPDLRATLRNPRQRNRSGQPARPSFRLLIPSGTERADLVESLGPSSLQGQLTPAETRTMELALSRFRNLLPAELAAAVEAFPCDQWGLMFTCRYRFRFLDLIRQNPALAFCVLHHEDFRRWPVSDVHRLAAEVSGERQRQILQWLGFPDSAAWVRILRKTSPAAVDVKRLLALRDITRVGGELEKPLRHLPRLNTAVLGLLEDPKQRPYLSAALIMEAGQATMAAPTTGPHQLLADLLEMEKRLYGPTEPRPIQSLARLQSRHDEALARFLKAFGELEPKPPLRPTPAIVRPSSSDRAPRQRTTPVRRPKKRSNPRESDFHPPPLPGRDTIEPITNPQQLRQEGRLQDNCAATYIGRVRSRRYYVYRVLKPQRATLSIKQAWDGLWKIDQLECSHNRTVSPLTRRHVRNWLSQQQPDFEPTPRRQSSRQRQAGTSSPQLDFQFDLPASAE